MNSEHLRLMAVHFPHYLSSLSCGEQSVDTTDVFRIAKVKGSSGKVWSLDECRKEIQMIEDYTAVGKILPVRGNTAARV